MPMGKGINNKTMLDDINMTIYTLYDYISDKHSLCKPATLNSLIQRDCGCSFNPECYRTGQCLWKEEINGVRNYKQKRKTEEEEDSEGKKGGEEVQPSTDGRCLVAKATLNRQNNGNMALFSELSSNLTPLLVTSSFSGIFSSESDSSPVRLTDMWMLY